MRQPLYRKTFHAPTLLREHPPQFRHPHKQALFDLAYPDGTASPAVIEVTRWAQDVPQAIALSPALDTELRADFYDYKPLEGSGLEWHVNFA